MQHFSSFVAFSYFSIVLRPQKKDQAGQNWRKEKNVKRIKRKQNMIHQIHHHVMYRTSLSLARLFAECPKSLSFYSRSDCYLRIIKHKFICNSFMYSRKENIHRRSRAIGGRWRRGREGTTCRNDIFL